MTKVEANIVDLRTDTPRSNEAFFVDTNVWYWMGYTNASHSSLSYPAMNYQVTSYPNYLNDALAAESELHVCTLSFAELAHIIERTEREIYNSTHGTNIKTKKFRRDFPTEYANVHTEVENAWLLAVGISNNQVIEANVTELMVTSATSQMKVSTLDGYDLFIIEALRAKKITQVITDDSDFGSVAGITVYTANRNLINDARSQGMLLTRQLANCLEKNYRYLILSTHNNPYST